MKHDVVIIGAGPGGLHCAKLLGMHGVDVVVLERSDVIGNKVCAGGVTWAGLLKRIPESLLELSFNRQVVRTPRQEVIVETEHPMVATVNRRHLGTYMAAEATSAGSELITGVVLENIDSHAVRYRHRGKSYRIGYNYLVGGDGSNSRVRSYLGLQTNRMGVGLNTYIKGQFSDMVWNFCSTLFGSGYSWIFPHSNEASFGAFAGNNTISAPSLRHNLLSWLESMDLGSEALRLRAGNINCDYSGWNFRPRFLLGDAAGLASPLTGEGIYPAIVSAEAVARAIVDGKDSDGELERLLIKRYKHEKMQRLASLNPLCAAILAELSAWLLRARLLSFDKFEMA